MKARRILVFPGSTEIALEIHRALCQCKEIVLCSAGMDSPGHAPYVFKQHYPVASVFEEDWIDELNAVIEAQGVDYIFPAHDDVLVALAKNTDRINAEVISSPLKTCLITRSKSKTYHFFEKVLRVPEVFNNIDSVREYPVFVKHDKGQGSSGAKLIRNLNELAVTLSSTSSSIILEYLPGHEYTIDCFSDRHSGLLFCAGRQRIRTRNGISMNSVPVNDPRLTQIAETIATHLELYGAWFFQVKEDAQGDYCLMEIAPRIAGTMALHRVYGINFPMLSIYEHERTPVGILQNEVDVEIDRALKNRYLHNLKFNQVYVDLDDTLIRDGKVNVRLVTFLFQCINSGIRLTLITKSRERVSRVLESFKVKQIFDEIIHIEPSAEKADFVTNTDSIFIDDSFSERLAMKRRRGIPTFDGSMLEMLIDEREW